MSRLIRSVVAALALCLLTAGNTHAQADDPIDVDLELSLLVDISGSIDDQEFELQRMGYLLALSSSAVWEAISKGHFGQIAVNFIYWSGEGQQAGVSWTLLDSRLAIQQFTAAIYGLGRPFNNGGTGLGSALVYGARQFQNSIYNSSRKIIDISGDGMNNDGVNSRNGRQWALANGVDTINGLVIGSDPGLVDYYRESVISSDGFVEVATNFADIEAALTRKLVREIQNPTVVPEPISMVLLGSGLVGIGAVRRRRLSEE